ncbi:uncharacterized protein LOC117573297 [Drosophila albomicans]|uniref:Uncharacterized protein LOC117573297 n=1 Tax=Drosophila albomicans TaxID=7291 RepID=A0A6P8X7Z3_DROAB|nr:uncharacterized protein LOC117573297 [Drosophila albomicans]
MPQSAAIKGYRLRRLPHRRFLVRHMLLNILQLLLQSKRPMRDIEIISSLCRQYERFDPAFQHQVRINLLDAVDYGLVKRYQLDVFALRAKRFAQIIEQLKFP